MTATADFPRLFSETPAHVEPPHDDTLSSVCRAFHQATGWQLFHEGQNHGPAGAWSMTIPTSATGGSPSHLIMQPPTSDAVAPAVPISKAQARALAESVGQLAVELARTQSVLRQRETELATAIPFAIELGLNNSQLAARLETILRDGAIAMDCQAAGLYMLDDATSQLKLRVQWGLSPKRFAAPARILSDAVADLEALCGDVVTLDTRAEVQRWQAPEDFSAAACVAVTSLSVPLGTIWFYSKRARSFSAPTIKLMQVLASHIATELDRESLWRETRQGGRTTGTSSASQVADIQWQQAQLAPVVPLLEGWQVSAARQFGEAAAGELLHWYVPETGRLSLTLGQASGSGWVGALSAARLSGALQSEVLRDQKPEQILLHLNQLLWMASTGDQRAALLQAQLDTDTGLLTLASAGTVRAVLVRDGRMTYVAPSPTGGNALLGYSPDSLWQPASYRMSRGDVLVLFSTEADSVEWDASSTAAPYATSDRPSARAIDVMDPAGQPAPCCDALDWDEGPWRQTANQIAEFVAQQQLDRAGKPVPITSTLVVKRMA